SSRPQRSEEPGPRGGAPGPWVPDRPSRPSGMTILRCSSPAHLSDRPAPPGQVVGVFVLRQGQGLADSGVEILGDGVGLDPRSQEVGPQELAERCRVLGETSGLAKLAGQAAVRVVLQLADMGRDRVEALALALVIVGVAPGAVVQIDPERGLLQLAEVDGDG